jgi:hypothetical protein
MPKPAIKAQALYGFFIHDMILRVNRRAVDCGRAG